jgi:hypothetical protein
MAPTENIWKAGLEKIPAAEPEELPPKSILNTEIGFGAATEAHS